MGIVGLLGLRLLRGPRPVHGPVCQVDGAPRQLSAQPSAADTKQCCSPVKRSDIQFEQYSTVFVSLLCAVMRLDH